MAQYALLNVSSQKAALKKLADMAQRGMIDPLVIATARAIVRDCDARDDMCELTAIFDAVKTGTKNVSYLSRGVRYVSDPRDADFFTGPKALLQMCQQGSCAEDCDGQSALVCALGGSLGFVMGLRAYQPRGSSDYEHVYPVAMYPKRSPTKVVGLDTTVPNSYVGWEPPKADVLTAWIH